jgi:hypothetical protein
MTRIRDDEELLAEYCRRFTEREQQDRGFRRAVSQTAEFLRWASTERSKDILRRAGEVMRQ